jgi:poly-gamma-glutamate capsule biosynthesis protein CapA/YwtB (metallophosphatase superfamily)
MDTRSISPDVQQCRHRVAQWVAPLIAVALILAACGTADHQPRGASRQPDQRSTMPPPAKFTIAATGDFLLHQRLIEQGAADAPSGRDDAGGRLGSGARPGYDFRPMLASLKTVIGRADLGICHLETPVGTREGPYTGYPSFNSPPQIVDAIKSVGYDTCSTASNHSVDRGAAGVQRTLRELDRAGIKHAGTARSASEASRVNMVNVKGVKVAQLSYTYGTNGISGLTGQPWLVNSDLDAKRIISDARWARRKGANVVILSMHWGQEYQHQPTAEQKSLARRLLSTPEVDLIIGHHVHVVQPFDKINGKWVAYGVGNQVSNPTANAPTTRQGLVARFEFRRGPDGQWLVNPSFVPTLVEAGPPIRLRTLTTGMGDNAVTAGGQRQAALEHTTQVVRSLGQHVPLHRDHATTGAASVDHERARP